MPKMTLKEAQEVLEEWQKRVPFYEKMVTNAIYNQLFLHGHNEFEGSYNPKLSIHEEAKIPIESMQESIDYLLEAVRVVEAEKWKKRFYEATGMIFQENEEILSDNQEQNGRNS